MSTDKRVDRFEKLLETAKDVSEILPEAKKVAQELRDLRRRFRDGFRTIYEE